MNIVAPEGRPIEPPADLKLKGVLARIWIACKELWCEAIPLWFPLLSVGIAILAFCFLDQAIGILQALIDQRPNHDLVEDTLIALQRWHYGAFVLALCLWSFVNYQSTYLLHQFDYNSPEYAGRFSDNKGKLGQFFKTLEQWSPVIAGIGPSIAVGIGFYMLYRVYSLAGEKVGLGRLIALYTPSILIALLVIWRPLRARNTDVKPNHSRQLNERLSNREVGLSLLLIVVLLVIVVATLVTPRVWSFIGPAATLCVIASAFVVFASLLVFWGGRWRVPLIFMTLSYCVLISLWNDNHQVRVDRNASSSDKYPSFGIRDVLDAWIQQLPDTERDRKPNQKTPMFIICAEGGGVRAAYWTARLLAYLEDTTRHYSDQYVPFSSRVLLVSGVSGGSLGAVTFESLLDAHTNVNPQTPDWFYRHTANFLGRDQLSEALAAGAFIDTAQRFIPLAVFKDHDRAAGLEKAWERAWSDSLKLDNDDAKQFCLFGDDFRKLWRHRKVFPNSSNGPGTWLPSLFLNGTSVEFGGRIITSDCVIPTGDYPGAQDALHLLNLRDGYPFRTLEPGILRVSSAINLSTRFPGISPSGELPGNGQQHTQRIVDGGYFDNSGAQTAWDNIVAVYNRRLEDPAHTSDIIPWIIVIRTGPVSKRETPIFCAHTSNLVNNMPAAVRPTPSHFMVDLLAPMRAFFNASAARSGDSIEALKDGVSLISQRLSHQDERGLNPKIDNVTGKLPLERVDYSVATRSNSAASWSTSNSPHHDPYVIELNLELDERQIEEADAEHICELKTGESATRQGKKLLLPLGWMLPAKAREVMENEVNDRLAPQPDLLDEKTHDSEWFRRLQATQLGRVLSLLHHERPTAEQSQPTVNPIAAAIAATIVTIAGITPKPCASPGARIVETAKITCEPSCHKKCNCLPIAASNSRFNRPALMEAASYKRKRE